MWRQSSHIYSRWAHNILLLRIRRNRILVFQCYICIHRIEVSVCFFLLTMDGWGWDGMRYWVTSLLPSSRVSRKKMGTSRSRDDPMLVMGWCIMFLLLLFDDASIKTCRLLLLLEQQQHRLVFSLLAPLAAPPPDLFILVVVILKLAGIELLLPRSKKFCGKFNFDLFFFFSLLGRGNKRTSIQLENFHFHYRVIRYTLYGVVFLFQFFLYYLLCTATAQ